MRQFLVLLCGNAYGDGCPPEKKGKVGAIHFNETTTGSQSAADIRVQFTLVKSPEYWLVLSQKYGLDTPYGRSMFAMLLTAYATGLDVNVYHCRDNGLVDYLILENQITN
ncbi:hypothetical protein HX776_09885 [Pseudomonas agarici]|uniref:hypothetical protein n=1 Tax=Pseudomonas agarici TaxID=46677 RepID=UPI00115FE503|nr:hypothetical protein [Pseudomonas agarici]NWC09125.1 hypothetical protein [Pseudomonas agarici]